MLTRYHIAIGDFKSPGQTLLRSTLSGITLLLPNELYTSIARGDNVLSVASDEPCTALHREFFVESNDADTRRALLWIDARIETTSTVSATLMLTGDCNMRCKYCFQDGLIEREQHFGGDLIAPFSAWVLDECNRVKASNFVLHLYGGEPLLRFGTIEKLVKRVRTALSRRKIGFQMSITTNGTHLDAETANRLYSLGCSLAIISLDGPKDVHDARRCLVDQGSSHDLVVRGVQNSLKRFNVLVRINLDRNNQYDVDERFIRYVKSLCDTNREHSQVSFEIVGPSMYPSKFLEDNMLGIEESGYVISRCYELALKNDLIIKGNMPSEVACEHIVKTYYTIDPRGNIFQCPGFVGFKEFCIGNIIDGVARERSAQLHEIKPWMKKPCLECRYLPQCNGGCRASAYIEKSKRVKVKNAINTEPYSKRVQDNIVGKEESSLSIYNSIYCRRRFFDLAFPSFLRLLYRDR